MEATTSVHKPPVLRHEWLKASPTHVIRSADETALVTFDPVTLTGGVYFIAPAMWRLYGPVSVDEFFAGLANVVRLPDGFDLQAWIDAVTGREVLQ